MKVVPDYFKVRIQAAIFNYFLDSIKNGIIHVGEDYGAWFYLKRDSSPLQCVLIGAGEDISLDLHLIEENHNCTILDPTPRAISYIASKLPKESRNYQFLPLGISDFDGSMKFHFPNNPTHVSLSAINLQNTTTFIELPVLTMSTLMSQCRIRHIDLLKLDIEGMSPRVLFNMFDRGIFPDQILTDLEYPISTIKLLLLLVKLRNSGYQLIFRRNRDCLFVQRSLLSDPSQSG